MSKPVIPHDYKPGDKVRVLVDKHNFKAGEVVTVGHIYPQEHTMPGEILPTTHGHYLKHTDVEPAENSSLHLLRRAVRLAREAGYEVECKVTEKITTEKVTEF